METSGRRNLHSTKLTNAAAKGVIEPTLPIGKSKVTTNQTLGSTLLFILLALLALPQLVLAQDRIDTNRPGFSTSANTLSSGSWQIETGIGYEDSGDSSNSKSLTLPSAQLRYGSSDDLELQFSWDGVTRSESNGGTNTGITDATIGVKIRISDAQARTMFALLAEVSVPIGDSDFTSDSWDPAIGLAWAHSGALSWSGTAKVTKKDSKYQFDNGLALNFATSTNSSSFIEWEANVPEDGDTVHKLNAGYLWWRGPAVQFDVNASIGLNDEAADYKLGVGWSYGF